MTTLYNTTVLAAPGYPPGAAMRTAATRITDEAYTSLPAHA
jgi:hypothetical protein